MKKYKKILITGGSGFIGSNLCRKLLQDENNHIICLDNNFTGTIDNISDLINNPRFKFVEHNIIEPFNTKEEIDEIYNLACPASPKKYQGKNAIYTTKTCIFGAINMLELAQKNNAKILQSSTSEVYGNSKEHPQKETYFGNVNPCGKRACYDEGKRSAESLFFDFNRIYNIKIKIVLIFNIFVPFMDKNDGRVVSNLICQALKGSNLTIYGDGKQTRSFCYIDDLIEGLIKMMLSNDNLTGPINLGNPCEYTINELANIIKEKINPNLKIKYEQLPSDDPIKRKPDITLAKKILNWEPKTTLSCGLDKTIKFFSG